jgi:hypothetical protein
MQAGDVMLRILQGVYWLVSLLFAGNAANEEVATRIDFNASAEAVWNHIMFYEEISGRSPLILRALLTQPIRTQGDKSRAGAKVRCVYRRGHLIKRITAVEPPNLLQFEVVEQRLGIERCVLTLGGSYQIHTSGEATEIVLITKYRAYLRPRYLWRPLEAFLATRLHNHILRSLGAAVMARRPAMRPVAAESVAP